MQHCCLCLRQGTDAAFKERGTRLPAEPEAQARGAAAARTEADRAARNTDALLVSAAQLGTQRGPRAAPAEPARAAGRHGAALSWVSAGRVRSASGAAAVPLANAGRTGMPASGQRGARARETGPVYTLSGGAGRTAHPAPSPLYSRAGAMWPMIWAWGQPGAARTGGKAERPMAGAPSVSAAAI